jgi:diguanylate cyclase (GGDEF)-like protein
MGNVLVLVYGCLFLGLLYRTVVVIAIIMVLAFFVSGFAAGIPLGNLAFGGAMLAATALMAVLAALRVEGLVRRAFIENRLLQEAAQIDSLTGILNRRAFDSLAARAWANAYAMHLPVQLILIDIDYFKEYNDVYGHQAGDKCLRRVAHIVQFAGRRRSDICARYGGEEFALFTVGSNCDEAAFLAEQIREAVAAECIPHKASGVTASVTVSVGSAHLDTKRRRSLAGMIQAADEALYRAKAGGRNRVVHADAGRSGETGVLEVITGQFRAAASE